jgi:Ca2+-transporting ATPase
VRILWAGLLMGLISLLVGYAGYNGWLATDLTPGSDEFGRWWRTLVFTTLTLSQMGNALAVRSNTESLFKIGFSTNWLMLAAVVMTFVLQMGVIYIPFLQNVFRTTALSLSDLALALVLSMGVLLAIELEKFIKRRRHAV